MTGDSGQKPPNGETDPAFDFASLPTPAIHARAGEAQRDRNRRLTVLSVLFVGGAIVVVAWSNRSPDMEGMNLPRVTLEVRGMT